MVKSDSSGSGRASIFGLLAIGLAAGVVGGMFVPQNGIRNVADRFLNGEGIAEAAEDDGHSGDSSGMFDVSLAAQDTYGVSLTRVSEVTDNYVEQLRLPAFVIERPAASNLQAACRLDGVVKRVLVEQGQSVRENDPLVEMELTGETLATTQSELLDGVQQLQIIDDDIRRLSAAAESGGIARKSLIERQYEQRRTKAMIESKRQELLVLGLSDSEVNGIVKNRQLVRTVVIRVPDGMQPEVSDTELNTGSQNESVVKTVSRSRALDAWAYSVESLNVSPGSVIKGGTAVADLAFHETLLIEGQAYERDLDQLARMMSEQTPLSVEIGAEQSRQVFDDLKIMFIDNHVDDQTQTYRFYLSIDNSVLSENMIGGRRYRAWRFKPGQRAHVRLPNRQWNDRLVLPLSAVARDGIDHVIFRQVAVHDHFHGDEPPHAQFKKITVSLDYEDQFTAVVDHRKQLSGKQKIARNNAEMLLRASQESGGGHGHDHGHEH